MGFKLTPRVAVLTFEEPFAGLEIRCRHDMPAEAYFKLVSDIDAVKDTEDGIAAYRAVMAMFADNIAIDWNAEDEDGQPIPLTAETLTATIPIALGNAILPRWKEAMVGVATPLEPPSSDGDTSGAG